ncbi:MAG: hypothetical protein R3F59_17125 [Myxococcota bacterium]
MQGGLAVALWLASARAARPGPCEPLDEVAFGGLLERARRSIDREDVMAFESASVELERRLPCLTYVPTREEWASWLVAVAVVDHFRGLDWQTPLATALQVDPGVDRLVGPSHEIARWSPAPSEPGPVVPRRVELFVDGGRAERLPPAHGVHLVQLRQDGALQSLLLRDQAVPAAWLGEAPAAPGGLLLSGAVGLAQQTQRVSEPGPFARNGSIQGADYGVTVRAWAWPAAVNEATSAGLWIDGTFTPRRPVDLVVAGALHGPSRALGVGVALASVRREVGGAVVEQVLAAPAITGALWTLGATTFDGGASLALAPSRIAGSLRGGITAPGRGTRMRVGLEGRIGRATYEQQGSGRTLSPTDLRALAHVGVVWGLW